MLFFLARRARTQAGLLTAVLAVLLLGATLLGTCALLLTTGQDRAQHAALQRTPAERLSAEVRLTDLGDDPAGATDAAAAVLRDALAPLPTSTSTWATSPVRDLPADPAGTRRLGYLADIDDLGTQAELTGGRWPTGSTGRTPREAVVPATTASRLGLALGDQLTLGPDLEPTDPGDTAPVTVVVVGTFTPRSGPTGSWSRDLLGGTGFTPQYDYGVFSRIQLPAYGPFVLAPGSLLGAGGGVDRVSLVAAPDVTGASPADLTDVRAGIAAARPALREALAGSDTASRFDARLPGTLDTIATQQAVTGSGVLVVALVGLALAGSALGLAARLSAGRRAGELALLTARGARRGRLVAQAVLEATLLALLAGAAAVPLSLLLFDALVRLPRLADAGLSGAAAVNPPLVLTVAAGVLVFSAVLVLPALRPDPAPGRASTRGAVVRSGADLLLLALAVLGWLQLHGRPGTAATGADPLLTTAPVLFLLAGAVLALRALPLLARVAERVARRSRRLVVPLAAWEVARRPQATGVAFLLVLATAAATFGLAFTSTWRSSQADQADALAGTALSVAAPGAAPLTQGAAVVAATGGTVSPVAVQPVSLGSVVRTGDGGSISLLAVDTAQAATLLRGRTPAGTSWAGLTADLAPAGGAGDGLRLAGPADLTVTGRSDRGVLTVRPTLLVTDAVGAQVPLTATPVPLDGQPHGLTLATDDGTAAALTRGLTVVGAAFTLELVDPDGIDAESAAQAAVTLTLTVPGAAVVGRPGWSAGEPAGDVQVLTGTSAGVTAGPDGAVLSVGADLTLGRLLLADGQLVTTAAPAPAVLPVLVSADLAEAAGAEPGDLLAVTVGTTPVRAEVTGVVPHVPSLPAAPGLLADYPTLAAALTAAGRTRPLTTGWWVADPADPAGAVSRLAAAGLPGAVTAEALTGELRDGPLRVGLLATVALLVGGAGALALAGTALHVVAALQERSVEVARLQGLGVSRRALAGSLLLEHATVTAVAVALGGAVGALAAWLLAPLMTVSADGGRPVPDPLPRWPWPTEGLLLGGVLLGCAAVAVPVAAALGRRAVATHLRLGGS